MRRLARSRCGQVWVSGTISMLVHRGRGSWHRLLLTCICSLFPFVTVISPLNPFLWFGWVSEENRDRSRSTFYPCRLMPATKNCLRAKRSVLPLRKRPFYGDGGFDSPPGCGTGASTKLAMFHSDFDPHVKMALINLL